MLLAHGNEKKTHTKSKVKKSILNYNLIANFPLLKIGLNNEVVTQ